MLRSRLFEEAITKLWEEGYISGEMHLGIGEEAIIAGVVSHLIPGDAISTDHRSTAPFIMRGIKPEALLLEFLGHPKGLCSGIGGHMHLFSKENLITSSGIVGAAGPSAVGFAFVSKYKKLNNIAIAFFGEGAMNQGMLLESMNLASVWNLPVLFVCKDNGWAITTRSNEVTAGKLVERANSFGVKGIEVDGTNVETVWETINAIISNLRSGRKQPFFLLAHCARREGHFLGDPLLRFHKSPVKEFGEVTGPLMKAVLSRKGARPDKRMIGLEKILLLIAKSRAQRKNLWDPLNVTRKQLVHRKIKITEIENSIQEEINHIVKSCMEIYNQEVSS